MVKIVGVGPLICRVMDSNETWGGTVTDDTLHFSMTVAIGLC